MEVEAKEQSENVDNQIVQHLGDFSLLLSYPRSIDSLVRSIESIMAVGNEKVNNKLEKLYDKLTAEDAIISTFEEAYTSSFDLNPKTHLYMAAHLYGETYKRSNFMIKLKQEYAKDDYSIPNNELPDHLTVLLDYMTICPKEPRDYLIKELILPVLEKIVLDKPIAIKLPTQSELRGMDKDLKEFEPVKKKNAYVSVLAALLYYLKHVYGGGL